MNKKRPIVTYIIDGKEKTEPINIFNRKNLEEKLFSSLYVNTFSQSKGMELKPEVEYIKFENIDFNEDVKIETKSDESLVILEKCNFLKNLTLNNGIFEIINPTFKLYKPEIRSSYSQDINVVFSEDKKQDLSIDFELKSEKFSLTNAKKIGDFRVNSNNVTIINSILKDFGHLNVFDIRNSDSIVIKDSYIASRFRITLSARELTLINSLIEGFEETPVELSVETILGKNFFISSDCFISLLNPYNFNKYLYKKSTNKRVNITDRDFLPESKLLLTTSLISDLKAIRNNAKKQIQGLKNDKSNEYIEEINYHKEKIKELEERSVADSKKLERKLIRQSINTYYNRK